MLYEFCEANTVDKSKSLIHSKMKENRVQKMIKLVEIIDNKFKEQKTPDPLPVPPPQVSVSSIQLN